MAGRTRRLGRPSGQFGDGIAGEPELHPAVLLASFVSRILPPVVRSRDESVVTVGQAPDIDPLPVKVVAIFVTPPDSKAGGGVGTACRIGP